MMTSYAGVFAVCLVFVVCSYDGTAANDIGDILTCLKTVVSHLEANVKGDKCTSEESRISELEQENRHLQENMRRLVTVISDLTNASAMADLEQENQHRSDTIHLETMISNLTDASAMADLKQENQHRSDTTRLETMISNLTDASAMADLKQENKHRSNITHLETMISNLTDASAMADLEQENQHRSDTTRLETRMSDLTNASASANLEQENRHLHENMTRLENMLDIIASGIPLTDCSDERIHVEDGIIAIAPPGSLLPFNVHCQVEASHTWTVLQRRVDGSVSFNRNWTAYKEGFGEVSTATSYWIGLEKMHLLTRNGTHVLRVSLEDFQGNTAYAEYTGFRVGSEVNYYRLGYDRFTGGDAGESLRPHNGEAFTTSDKNNDLDIGYNCAVEHLSGWWFNGCFTANLNGEFRATTRADYRPGIEWYAWKRTWEPLKTASMKIRRVA